MLSKRESSLGSTWNEDDIHECLAAGTGYATRAPWDLALPGGYGQSYPKAQFLAGRAEHQIQLPAPSLQPWGEKCPPRDPVTT